MSNIQVAQLLSFVREPTIIKAQPCFFCRRKRSLNQSPNQKRFHDYLSDGHNGIDNPEITILAHSETMKALREKELYWHHKFETYVPLNLNEREIYAQY